MEDLIQRLKSDLKELKKIERKGERFLKDAPQGSLLVSKNNNTNQYYWRKDCTNKHGKYIKKNNEKIIQALAQKEYARKVLAVVKKQEEVIEKFLGDYYPNEIEDVYDRIHLAKRQWINPYRLSENEYAEQWEKNKKDEKDKINKTNVNRHEMNCKNEDAIFTEKGERVRSKSEKILADKLYIMGIPYVYEVPLYLEGYGYVRPDFTILNKKKRKEYYWEHLGMMDEPFYCEKAIKKIELYEKNGIFTGQKLILTYETSEHPLNARNLEMLIQEYLV